MMPVVVSVMVLAIGIFHQSQSALVLQIDIGEIVIAELARPESYKH